MPCRLLVKIPTEKDESPTLSSPRNLTNISDSTRTSWVTSLKRYVQTRTDNQPLRPLDFLLYLDGTVEPPPSSSHPPAPTTYPSPYRIPPSTIADLAPTERVRRAELFALGSLIYELYAHEAPFERLTDNEIQAHYRRTEFPHVTHLPQWPVILSCWSVEFAAELVALLQDARAADGNFKRATRAAGTYIRAHPVRFGLQCAGAAVGIAATVAVPVLGAVGFGALGPVAGSSAAAWQAGMGAVQAGSFFAWCQSAAMGGAAVNGIVAAGVAGGGVVLGSTAVGVLVDGDVDGGEKERLVELFGRVCRRSDRLGGGSSPNVV